jgi:hypothetical protein
LNGDFGGEAMKEALGGVAAGTLTILTMFRLYELVFGFFVFCVLMYGTYYYSERTSSDSHLPETKVENKP